MSVLVTVETVCDTDLSGWPVRVANLFPILTWFSGSQPPRLSLCPDVGASRAMIAGFLGVLRVERNLEAVVSNPLREL